MKTKLLLTFFACFFCWIVNGQNVIIPDVNFKAVLVANPNINTNADAEIQISEAATFSGTISVSASGISDLTGIGAFTALNALYCDNNFLSSLDVSANKALTTLGCHNNNVLTNLNVSGATALTKLYCYADQLTSLNVSNNTALNLLNCCSNYLTSLNISANTALTDLACYNNQLTSLNVSSNTALKILYCNNNSLVGLNVSANTALTFLACGFNQLTSLNVSANTALTELNCYNNQLTSLNVSANTALNYILCNNNQLTSLDVSANTALKTLWCYNNQLANLNAKNGNNINFTWFSAHNNPNLACIQVDNATYMNTNWWGGKDSTASYSQNCSTTSIANISNENEIVFYPNPVSESFTIKLDKPSDAKICVYDILGNCVHTFSMKNSTETIDLSKQAKGIYFVKVADVNGYNTFKIIKE